MMANSSHKNIEQLRHQVCSNNFYLDQDDDVSFLHKNIYFYFIQNKKIIHFLTLRLKNDD